MVLTSDDIDDLKTIILGGSVVSCVFCFFVMILYLFARELRNPSFALVFLLCFTSFCSALVLILAILIKDSLLCTIAGVATTYFAITSVTTTAVITSIVYRSISWGKEEIQTYAKRYGVLNLILPILVAPLPFLTDSYGQAEPATSLSEVYCWIRTNHDKPEYDAWKVILFFAPLWTVIAYNTFIYLKTEQVKRRLIGSTQHSRTIDQSDNFDLLSKLKYYPMALACCWLFGTINFFYIVISGDDNFWLWVFHGLFGSLQGFCYGIIFLLCRPVQDYLRRSCPCLKPPRTKSRNQELQDLSLGNTLDSSLSTTIGSAACKPSLTIAAASSVLNDFPVSASYRQNGIRVPRTPTSKNKIRKLDFSKGKTGNNSEHI
mmetsp:Transcript_62793/g.72064  ORF Transcript_62793/g.72064 Transcript_62793/m.72064 type:complete len:375 (-) Transcript_62793:192-1316(-)